MQTVCAFQVTLRVKKVEKNANTNMVSFPVWCYMLSISVSPDYKRQLDLPS